MLDDDHRAWLLLSATIIYHHSLLADRMVASEGRKISEREAAPFSPSAKRGSRCLADMNRATGKGNVLLPGAAFEPSACSDSAREKEKECCWSSVITRHALFLHLPFANSLDCSVIRLYVLLSKPVVNSDGSYRSTSDPGDRADRRGAGVGVNADERPGQRIPLDAILDTILLRATCRPAISSASSRNWGETTIHG